MKRKQKTQSKTKIEKPCDNLWSKCVRTRQRVCRMCGSDKKLQAHHIRSRSHNSTRYDFTNGLCLCAKCHIMQKFNPEKFQDKVIEVIGNAEYERLKRKSLETLKLNAQDLIELRTELKMILRDLEDDYGTLDVYKIAEDAGL